MNNVLGEEKLSKNISSLKKKQVKGEIRLSVYSLVNKCLAFFTKNSPETKIRILSKELAVLKYENDNLKQNLFVIEKEKKGLESQVNDLLYRVDLDEFRDLKKNALDKEMYEQEIEHYRIFLSRWENLFEQIEATKLIEKCLEELGIAKDNFQKLKVVRYFLTEFKKFEWMKEKLNLFYEDAKGTNIKDILLVTNTLNQIKKEFNLNKNLQELKKDFKLLKDSLKIK